MIQLKIIKIAIEQLADIFNALSQNNQSKDNNTNDKNINTEQDKENIQNVQNDVPIENKQEININLNNNIFSFDSPQSKNNQIENKENKENKDNLEFPKPEHKNENIEINFDKLDIINNQNNQISNNDVGFSYDFVKQENNNTTNIEEIIPISTGFDYEAFNNAKNTQPKTNNDKLDNALKNLF